MDSSWLGAIGLVYLVQEAEKFSRPTTHSWLTPTNTETHTHIHIKGAPWVTPKMLPNPPCTSLATLPNDYS